MAEAAGIEHTPAVICRLCGMRIELIDLLPLTLTEMYLLLAEHEKTFHGIEPEYTGWFSPLEVERRRGWQ